MRKVHPVSEAFFSHSRLVRAIRRLLRSEEGHNHLGGVNHAARISMVVGIRIFSIVGGLGFVGDLIRGYGLWRLLKLVLHQLRMLRMLEGVMVRLKNWWRIFAGFMLKVRGIGLILCFQDIRVQIEGGLGRMQGRIVPGRRLR